MALRDWLYASEPVATATTATSATNETLEAGDVANVATVAVANASATKTESECEAVTAFENATTAGKPIPVAKVAGVAAATSENSRGEEHDALFVSERLATATPATPATPSFDSDKAVTKT